MEGIKLRSNAKDETELESFSVWSDQYQKGAIIIDASPMVNSGNIRPAEPDDMRGKTAYILRFPATIQASQLLSSLGVMAIKSHIRPNS